jgi:hypothetical protein
VRGYLLFEHDGPWPRPVPEDTRTYALRLGRPAPEGFVRVGDVTVAVPGALPAFLAVVPTAEYAEWLSEAQAEQSLLDAVRHEVTRTMAELN